MVATTNHLEILIKEHLDVQLLIRYTFIVGLLFQDLTITQDGMRMNAAQIFP